MTDLGNIKIKKINHVAIPINNRKESFSLYRDFLGLTIIPSMVDEKHVTGWDDPRMPPISGLRRRGYTPNAIKSFIEKVVRY